jgi:hypothetical protein
VDEAEVGGVGGRVGAGRRGGGQRRGVREDGAGGGGVGGEREGEGLGDVAGDGRVAGQRRRRAGDGEGRPWWRRRGQNSGNGGAMCRGQDCLQDDGD